MKILILEDEIEILEFLQDCTESILPEAEVIAVDRLQKAKDALAAQSIDLVIADQNLPDGKGDQLFQFIEENKKLIPFVLCSSDKQEDIPALQGKKIFGEITKPYISESLQTILAKFVSGSKEPSIAKVLNDYIPVRTRTLLKTQPIPCDTFLRLGATKYIKVLNAGTTFAGDDLDHYLKKNVYLFYIQKDNWKHYLDSLSKTVISLLKSKECNDSDLADVM